MIQSLKNLFQINPDKSLIEDIDYCQNCGACCSYFRVIFDLRKNMHVPHEYIFQYENGEVAMKGAEIIFGKCEALKGTVGHNCSCEIYEDRPDVCRKFSIWNQDGTQNSECIKAREHNGLVGKIDLNRI